MISALTPAAPATAPVCNSAANTSLSPVDLDRHPGLCLAMGRMTMMMLKRIFFRILNGVCFCLLPLSFAAAQEPISVRIGQSSLTDVQVASIVTARAGIFSKYGLATELIALQGGPQTIQALLANSLQFADMPGTAVINSRVAGGNAVAILYHLIGVTHGLFVRPEIKTPRDLAGKKVGIVRIGGLAEFLARYMLTEKLGLKANEVELVQVGGQSVRVAALTSGAIQASVFSPPESTRVEKLGFREIADASQLEYPTGVIATTTQVLSAQPALAERVLKSYLEGIAFFRQQKEKTIAILQKEFRLTDRAEVEGMYVKLSKVVPARPRFPSKGIETVLEDLKARNPNAAKMDPNLFYDSGIVKKLEAQGFIANLYQ
jgi:NitT/TauT family transport system substrate-binding protein